MAYHHIFSYFIAVVFNFLWRMKRMEVMLSKSWLSQTTHSKTLTRLPGMYAQMRSNNHAVNRCISTSAYNIWSCIAIAQIIDSINALTMHETSDYNRI